MENTVMGCDSSQVVRLADIRQGREFWFPSSGSLEWHYRLHKVRYINEGAVVVIRGALFVYPGRFDHIFAAIARDQARALLPADMAVSPTFA